MKKKTIIITIVLILAIIWLLSFGRISGKKPFKNLNYSDVLSVSILAVPPNTTTLIKDSEKIREIVDILNTVVIYQKDDSGRDYSGQLVQFTLIMKNGSTLEVGEYNPFIFVNGECYKTKYEPCEKLNSLGNKIIK